MEYTIWELITETGWTWEYVEGLTLARMNDIIQIKDAIGKARAHKR